jgi:hypothetical protein
MLEPLALIAALSAPAGEPRIELYTMGQGDELFERFGHAAVCVVHDRAPARSRCYNYGTTDFGSPPEELGWAFLRGRARFWVSMWPLERMLASYEADDRTIWRQRLALSSEQVRRVTERLAHDAREDNRYYLYHHFYDNCSTRIRDVLDVASDGALNRQAERPYTRTFRELGREGLAEAPAALVIGDLLVGRDADRTPTVREAMFLPDVLRSEVTRELAAPPELVYQRRGRAISQVPPRNAPWQLALAGVVALPALASRLARRAERVALAASGVLLGLVGLSVWLVALVSTVPELRANEALAVFWPSDLLLGALKPRWRVRYAKLRLFVLLCVSALAAVDLLKQPLLLWVIVAALPMLLALWGAEDARASSTTRATA